MGSAQDNTMDNLFLSANVPDPTDFPPQNTSPGLRTLDASMRCTICGEIYDAPVTLGCGHCFCSFCIRSALAEKQECPTCRKTAIEGHIRPNPAIEEIVSSWKVSRKYILKLSKEDAERGSSSNITTPILKKRKFDHDVERRDAGSSLSPSKSKQTHKKSEDLTVPSSDVEEEDEILPLNAEADQFVECPLCSRKVKLKLINQHIDRGCRDTPPNPSTSSEWKRLMSVGKSRQSDDEDDNRLPKASYDTLKDRQLRKMLVDYGLWNTGDRSQLIHRHQRWIMIYNANIDRSLKNRKSKQELKKELKRWEEDLSRKKRVVVDNIADYQRHHKDEFAQLIEAASSNKDQSRPREKKNILDGDGTQTTNKDVTVLDSKEADGETPL